MSSVQRFFRYLSMTDGDVLTNSSQSSRMTQTALGALVFLTGSLAWASGGYALYVTFNSVPLSAAVGMVYAGMIVMIDRLIVGARSRWVAATRVLLALAIGVVVAVPLELRLFEDRIQQQLSVKNQEANRRLRASLKEESDLQRLNRQIDQLRKEQAALREETQEAREAQIDEITGAKQPGEPRTGVKGRGPAFEAAQTREKAVLRQMQAIKEEISRLQSRKQQIRQKVDRQYEAAASEPAFDLLARYEALGQVKQESIAARHMAWGARFLIVLLELSPALLKVLRRRNDYETAKDAMVEAKKQIEVNRINAFSNSQIQKIKSNGRQLPTPTLQEFLNSRPAATP